ncbi:MAG TPA: hypothetical protein VN451_10385 [Chitinophagaceae bacterium]|nr:hypothetical protein [Chitinophagaceae bacterium]
MKKIISLLLIFIFCISAQAQKKSKGKSSPVIKDSTNYLQPDKKSKGKKDKKEIKKSEVIDVNYTPDVIIPKPDSTKQFTGLIKYRMTSDDPADRDSIFIVFGENKIRVTMFQPGYREGQVFETNLIADLKDSMLYELNVRNMTYTTEKLSARNEGTAFSLAGNKKTGQILTYTCNEYAGQMTTREGDIFQAACLLSNQHSYIYAMDYNFMNVHPLVLGYKIVLGFRTKSADNENTYIIAYKIEAGNTSSYFDLSQYHPK